MSQEEIDTFFAEATSGDYDNLLETIMAWVAWQEPPRRPPVPHDVPSDPRHQDHPRLPTLAGCRLAGGPTRHARPGAVE